MAFLSLLSNQTNPTMEIKMIKIFRWKPKKQSFTKPKTSLGPKKQKSIKNKFPNHSQEMRFEIFRINPVFFRVGFFVSKNWANPGLIQQALHLREFFRGLPLNPWLVNRDPYIGFIIIPIYLASIFSKNFPTYPLEHTPDPETNSLCFGIPLIWEVGRGGYAPGVNLGSLRFNEAKINKTLFLF